MERRGPACLGPDATRAVSRIATQSVSLEGIDKDEKRTLRETLDSNGHTSGKSLPQQQTGVTGEVKKLKASNLPSSKPLLNNQPLAKDNMVNKSNETVSGGSNAQPSGIRHTNKNKNDSRDGLQCVKSSKIHRRTNFRFLTSWSPGVYEGQVNRRGLPHGHGTLKRALLMLRMKVKCL